jgi:hypothetical protein
MKSILYVGATLMIGASIYGFVDYKQTSRKKEFTSMYEENKKAPVVSDDVKVTEPVNTKDVVASDKEPVVKKQVLGNKEEATIAVVKPIAEEERIAAKETKEIGKTTVAIKASKESSVAKKVKKKKKLDHRIFSRAPLRDEEINMPELIKPEEKKLVQKDSFGEKKEQ